MAGYTTYPPTAAPSSPTPTPRMWWRPGSPSKPGYGRVQVFRVACPLSTVHCPGEQLLWHPLPWSGPRPALAPLPLRLGHVRVKLQAIIEAFHQNNTSIFSVIDKLRKLLHLLRLMWRWEGGQLINRVGGKLALVNRSEGNSFKPWAAMRKV